MIKTLEDFKVYNLAMEFGEEVWQLVSAWRAFERDTVGKQLVRAVDSIAANLSEGLGHYHFKESKNFGYYSRGSLFESKTWMTKAFRRSLITKEDFSSFQMKAEAIGKMLNRYIDSIGSVQEPAERYALDSPDFPMPDA